MTRARDLANLIGSGNFTTETLTATAGQTAFTPSNTFTSNFLQVFYNGLLLDPTVDYTENGTTITLTVAATAGDEMEVVTYNTFSVGDAITQTEADVRYVNASGDTVSGDLIVDTKVGIGTSSPAAKLDVKGSSGDQLRLRTADTEHYAIGRNASTGLLEFYGSQAGYTGYVFGGVDGERMRIDSSGRVTMPYQPLFRGYAIYHGWPNTLVQYPGNTITSFGVDENVGNHWNNTTGVFTCPVAGRYMVSSYFIKYPVAANCHVDVWKNGTQIEARVRPEETSGYSQGSGMTYITCAANDTLQWKYFGSAGIHSSNGAWTIALVG